MKDYITSPMICQYLFEKISDYFNLAMQKLRFSLFFSVMDGFLPCRHGICLLTKSGSMGMIKETLI